MPELPEVQTVVDGLNACGVFPGELRRIVELRPGTVSLRVTPRWPQALTHVSRRGKFILLHGQGDLVILAHLRMTGKFTTVEPTGKTAGHVRAVFEFSDGRRLWFVDPRTFGTVEILSRKQAEERLKALGPDPFDKAFDTAYLYDRISIRTAPVKNLLLHQGIVAGLGNIYACEILREAGVNPTRAGDKIRKEEAGRIVAATRRILTLALEHNGATIDDFRRVDEKTGEFQRMLRVYGKKTCPCGGEVKRIVQAGRGTWYCPQCQK